MGEIGMKWSKSSDGLCNNVDAFNMSLAICGENGYNENTTKTLARFKQIRVSKKKNPKTQGLIATKKNIGRRSKKYSPVI